jgi:hypothetical protein
LRFLRTKNSTDLLIVLLAAASPNREQAIGLIQGYHFSRPVEAGPSPPCFRQTESLNQR